jgi:hypothetical protein
LIPAPETPWSQRLFSVAMTRRTPTHSGSSQLVGWLGDADERLAASAARVLSRHRCVKALLDALRNGGSARLWALTALGDVPAEVVLSAAHGALNEDATRALEPMWLAQRDWLRHDMGRGGMQALDVQTVRFGPIELVQQAR